MTDEKRRGYRLSDYDFDLPDRLIAQHPAQTRSSSRLMIIDRRAGTWRHRQFTDIAESLLPGDVLVFNDARVIHGRIPCHRSTGGACELMLTDRLSPNTFTALTNRLKRLVTGEELVAHKKPSVRFRILKKEEDHIVVESSEPLDDEGLRAVGEIPLPPYIRRPPTPDDEERYQTVYAASSGAVAAPTAGLHFTHSLMERLRERGVAMYTLTLQVSWGTFMPVRTDSLDDHRMHQERYDIPDATAAAINDARREGRRIIAVGTTVLRVLESTFRDGKTIPGSGVTDIFIRPPMRIMSIDGLLTNFHTPGSTLLMLVAAFAGYDTVMAAYRQAVDLEYRFFSYGDAMLIT